MRTITLTASSTDTMSASPTSREDADTTLPHVTSIVAAAELLMWLTATVLALTGSWAPPIPRPVSGVRREPAASRSIVARVPVMGPLARTSRQRPKW